MPEHLLARLAGMLRAMELATSGFGLDETAAAALASGLAGNTTLQTLSLDLDFPMSDEATARIASALARNDAW